MSVCHAVNLPDDYQCISRSCPSDEVAHFAWKAFKNTSNNGVRSGATIPRSVLDSVEAGMAFRATLTSKRGSLNRRGDGDILVYSIVRTIERIDLDMAVKRNLRDDIHDRFDHCILWPRHFDLGNNSQMTRQVEPSLYVKLGMTLFSLQFCYCIHGLTALKVHC
ncbi:hypothetical protein Ae201684_013360 [Aphanomyces euteiches]|uniref:Uncharacterized protein n=1 Tax=Aphanomyces euteiches TaxID=100861 RepID=A0A6G0WN48_9STRA|nr:hypothetical protein Ae201684_013360 [Aphanomyces euteiches]